MKLIIAGLLLYVSFAFCATLSGRGNQIVVTEDFYLDEFIIYRSQNDIVDIFVPLNKLNSDDNPDVVLFFVEKDLATGEDKGLFIRNNNMNVTKLLDHGRRAAGNHGENGRVFFAAEDGIYMYNAKENKAEKYGTLTDDLIDIAVDNTSDVIYALNKNKELYKVTDDGEKHIKIGDVTAEQIVTDCWNNLYYTNSEGVFVFNQDGVEKVESVAETHTSIKLIRPAFIYEDAVPIIVDDTAYVVYANATLEPLDIEIKAKPTAYSIDAALIQYYGYKKNIYELNIMTILMAATMNELQNYLNSIREDIRSAVGRSRRSLPYKIESSYFST